MDNHTETAPKSRQESHLVSRNTWTAPELETVLPPLDVSEVTNTTNSSPPTLGQKPDDKIITTNLPQLPHAKGIRLPPIRRKCLFTEFSSFTCFFLLVSSSPVGLKEETVTSEQVMTMN